MGRNAPRDSGADASRDLVRRALCSPARSRDTGPRMVLGARPRCAAMGSWQHETTEVEQASEQSESATFEQLGLSAEVLKAVTRRGLHDADADSGAKRSRWCSRGAT